ncbi:MAG: hypothetical protein LBB63_01655 [Holosporaceae bacterium]|jgi:outer membrane protein assembly factor BamE (lipoprotein component of BamABCDE complex)|nr:hypothetical protein [Holosporaceae bacterium]
MRKEFFLAVMVLLVSCQPMVNPRGNMDLEENIAGFAVGKTTADEVLEKCGTPSLHRDNFNWIYISSEASRIAFKPIELRKRVIVRMRFNKNRILESLERLKPSRDKEIATDEETTALMSERQAIVEVNRRLHKTP